MICFVEKPLVRLYTKGNIDPITRKTLTERLEKVVRQMEFDIMKQLPKKFGVAFDGWSDKGVHYCAVFAVGPGLGDHNSILLGFSPFEQSWDLSAQQHLSFLTAVMSDYDRVIYQLQQLLFFWDFDQ